MKNFLVILSFWVIFVFTVIASFNVIFPLKYKSVIEKESKNYKVDKVLIASIIYVESGFNKKAKSNKGAIGLMQLMPSTAKSFYFNDNGFYDDLLFNPEVNINIGVKFLNYLFNKYDDELTVLACYNAGEGNVLNWSGGETKIKKSQIKFKETLKYVEKVQKAKKIYKNRV